MDAPTTSAVILAAGSGRRLGGQEHKALVDVGGRTLLGRLLDGLSASGVTAPVLVTGYRAADLQVVARAHCPDVAFVHNDRWHETNNVVSLALGLAATPQGADIIVVECDLVLSEGVLALVTDQRGNIAVLDRYRLGMEGTAALVEGEHVARLVPASHQDRHFRWDSAYKTVNLYRFEAAFCQRTLRPMLETWATHIDPGCFYEIVLGVLVEQRLLRLTAALVSGQPWAEVDDRTDLRRARYLFEPQRRFDRLEAWRGGYWNCDVVDFVYPRNMYFPPPALLGHMREALPELLQNYGSKKVFLDEKLAEFIGCAPERTTTLHGACQIYPLLHELLPCEAPLIPDPTFGEYERVLPHAATYRDGPGVDLDALEDAVRASTLTVVVNPNNPTGTLLPTLALYELAARHPDQRFLVDESFIDFSSQPSLIGLLEQTPLDNVVVLRSLSKVLGSPGLRLGFAYTTDADFNRRLAARLPIWGLSALAEFLIELLPRCRLALERSLARSADDRAGFMAALATLPAVARVYPSGGNFLLVELRCGRAGADRLARRLLDAHGLLVKDASARFTGDVGRLRLAVRTPEDNDRLVQALQEELHVALG